MGDNSSIKRFRASAPTVARSLFDDRPDHGPTIARLLSTPWVTRGSELQEPSGPELVQVEVGKGGEPRAFIRHSANANLHAGATTSANADTVMAPRRLPALRRAPRRYVVEHVVSYWVEDREWFTHDAHIQRTHYRVLARPATLGGSLATTADRLTVDLVYDRRLKEWSLTTER